MTIQYFLLTHRDKKNIITPYLSLSITTYLRLFMSLYLSITFYLDFLKNIESKLQEKILYISKSISIDYYYDTLLIFLVT